MVWFSTSLLWAATRSRLVPDSSGRDHPLAHLSFVCLRHAAALRRSAKTTPSRSIRVGQFRASHRRWIAKPRLGARFRARTAVIREQPLLNNRIIRPVYKRSQPLLHWTSHKVTGQYQPTGIDQLEPQREFRSNALRNDLTPTCRDRTLLMFQTFRCQTRQQYMTLPHQDARLEEDAANGASVHNLPQVNASVLPATCVEYDSLMVKRVYNSGATVKPIITTYMHIVSMEGSVMIMNCSQNKLTDQDAVDAVTRQRDTITRTAADTEVLLPFAQDPDQASTAAPPDDERDLFGREEALRMDEEIMNFQWFEHVTWDSIKDLRGTTYVEPPHEIQVCTPARPTCHPLCHHSSTTQPPPASESAWKSAGAQQLAPSWDDAVSQSPLRATAHTFLDARLDLFWAEDWSALWAMVRAECDVAPVFRTSRKSAEQKLSRVRKVATLAE